MTSKILVSNEIKELAKRLRYYYRDLTSRRAEGDLVGDDVILSAADTLEALDALEALTEERDRLKDALNEWVRENAPGGWIDALRKKVQERDTVLDHLWFNWIDCPHCDRNKELMESFINKEEKKEI